MSKRFTRRIKKDYRKLFNNALTPVISVSYIEDIVTEETGEGGGETTSSFWSSKPATRSDGFDTKAIIEIVTNLNIHKYRYADIDAGKVIFYIPVDFDLSDKRDVRVVWQDKEYRIRRVVPDGFLGDEPAYQVLIQE